MKSKKLTRKGGYRRKSTVDLSKVVRVVDPVLKARNDEMFKGLVDNLNRNASKQDEEPDQE